MPFQCFHDKPCLPHKRLFAINAITTNSTINLQFFKEIMFFNQVIVLLNYQIIFFAFKYHFKFEFSLQLACGSLGQFFTKVIIGSMFSTCKWHCLRVVNTPTKLNIHLVSICELMISRILFARKPTFKNDLHGCAIKLMDLHM